MSQQHTGVQRNNLSHESISLSSPENSISKTIEEMQRVLNNRNFDSFPETAEPTPEEILNLYSEDLGICLSSRNGSPRGGDIIHLQHLTIADDLKSNKNRRNKNSSKQLKSKSNTITKQENKKEKKHKSDMPKENKLKELIKIYGGSEKIKKPYSDLKLNSKSDENRKISATALKPSNASSKASSIPSRKSRRKNKNKKYVNQNDNYVDNVFLENSTRLSSKRKTNPKANVSNVKKGNLKRNLKFNPVKGDTEPKLNRDFPNSNKENKHCKNKLNNSKIDKPLKPKNKASSQIKEKLYSYSQESKRNTLTKGISKTSMNVNSHDQKYIGPENNVNFNDLENFQNNYCNQYTKHKLATKHSSEKGINLLSKKGSTEEANHNKNNVFVKSDPVERSDNVFAGEHSQYDHFKHETFNDDFVSKSLQGHYALPTQSSRLKEVDRFLNGHYQHLPFVIGQSTNKSHNLWVNIQEALSLIKQKLQQPLETPNSPRNDCVEYERPPSVLSKLTTKSIRKPHQCPALRADSLYDIPEANLEAEEAGVSSWEDNPECIKANIDPNYVRSRCSCVAQPVMNYKNVLRQIFGGNSEGVSENGAKGDVFYDQGGDSYIAELKKALITFTQDFEEMNK